MRWGKRERDRKREEVGAVHGGVVCYVCVLGMLKVAHPIRK